VGTVDKFQGQEAPVVIYTMASSSPEDAPRGMEFLYSLNRLNVATSRARCLAILVASPRLYEAECRSPAQMKLANALCRYREMATELAEEPSSPRSARSRIRAAVRDAIA
jgi:superfamily I DNA and/or RNA helicase